MQTLSVLSRPKPTLFVYNLDLLVEDLAGKLVGRHACLAEALAKASAPSNAAHLSRQDQAGLGNHDFPIGAGLHHNDFRLNHGGRCSDATKIIRREFQDSNS
jgi:hypothetical protein